MLAIEQGRSYCVCRDAVSTERPEVHVETVRTEGTSVLAKPEMGGTFLC